jgi:hypothetical protein
MANTSPKFGALVVASLAGVVGTKYLVGGALALLDASVVSSVMVMGMVPLTLVAGVLLCVVGGAFAEASALARPLGILTFLVVMGLSVPAIVGLDPVIIIETLGMSLAVLYLLVRNPIEIHETLKVDENESASRVGSTLR